MPTVRGGHVPVQVVPNAILTLCQVVGFFPLNYAKSGENVVFSKPILCWHVAYVTVLTAVTGYALCMDVTGYTQRSEVATANNSLSAMLAIFFNILAMTVVSVATFVSNGLTYSKYVEMTLSLARFDRRFHLETPQTSYRKRALTAFCLLTGLLCCQVRSVITRSVNVAYILPIAAYYTQLASFLHFTYIVDSITTRFVVIKRKIKDELMTEVNYDHCIPDNGASVTGYRLKSLIDHYSNLCETTKLASDFFSSQLFVAIMSSFLHLTLTLYFLFLSLAEHTMDSDAILTTLLSVCWSFAHSSHLVLLVVPCTTLQQVVSETAPMICGIMNKNLSVHTINQLESFLISLLHLKVNISAGGFFVVHSSVLTSILSSVTTYLVVLLQFHEVQT